MKHIDWVWMTHPSRNNGNKIPVQIFEDEGVVYYRPFDESGTEFEMAEIDSDWAEAVAPITTLKPEQPAQQPKPCTWSQSQDQNMPDTWHGNCGAAWTFTEGSLLENDMHYCLKCGGRLQQEGGAT